MAPHRRLNLNGSVGEYSAIRGLTMKHRVNREFAAMVPRFISPCANSDLLRDPLLREPNRVQTRNQILASVWGRQPFR